MATEAIVDSSVAVALVTLEGESVWASRSMQEHRYFHALDLSFYEVANALRNKVSDNLSARDAEMAFKQAESMMNLFSIHNFSEVVIEALAKAIELKISVYDAAFLSLADKLDAHLLTLDRRLANKLEHTKYYSLIECPYKKTEGNSNSGINPKVYGDERSDVMPKKQKKTID